MPPFLKVCDFKMFFPLGLFDSCESMLPIVDSLRPNFSKTSPPNHISVCDPYIPDFGFSENRGSNKPQKTAVSGAGEGIRTLDPNLGKKLRQLRQNFFRSEEHTSELQSLMRISYAVFCL